MRGWGIGAEKLDDPGAKLNVVVSLSQVNYMAPRYDNGRQRTSLLWSPLAELFVLSTS